MLARPFWCIADPAAWLITFMRAELVIARSPDARRVMPDIRCDCHTRANRVSQAPALFHPCSLTLPPCHCRWFLNWLDPCPTLLSSVQQPTTASRTGVQQDLSQRQSASNPMIKVFNVVKMTGNIWAPKKPERIIHKQEAEFYCGPRTRNKTLQS